MALTTLQAQLLSALQSEVAGKRTRNVVLVREWLGYLPFGLYRWLEVDGESISERFLPDGWSADDMQALEVAGFLTTVSDWQDAEDSCHKKTTYEVSA